LGAEGEAGELFFAGAGSAGVFTEAFFAAFFFAGVFFAGAFFTATFLTGALFVFFLAVIISSPLESLTLFRNHDVAWRMAH
jgi:hypothetical protein